MGTAGSGARSWSPALPTALRSLLRFDTSHGNLELTVEVIWNSRLKPGSTPWHLALVVEVQQCPLRSRLRPGSVWWDLEVAAPTGARGWGPAVPIEIWSSQLRSGSALTSGARGWGAAVPTAIWSSQLRSGSAHWDLELTVEARQCPLTSGARSWGPPVPTAIWSSRLRSGSAHWDLEFAVGGSRKEGRKEGRREGSNSNKI